jgi:Fur family peroxide stress response transcriptional regulator
MDSKIDLKKLLIEKQIKPSHQRIKVLEYLVNQQTHPNVDQIFNDLHEEIPTLSKSTVYNTLNAFVEANLVRALPIDENEARYDFMTENHGHIRCESCGTIYNFEVDIDHLPTIGLDGFVIKEKSIFFRGVCPNCLNKAR